MDKITPVEREAIKTYKEYQKKHLANMARLSDYYAPDFDPEAYPNIDKIDALQNYLSELRKYYKHLSKAAGLRQKHYEEFVMLRKNEDYDHKAWREGLNAISKNCEEKIKFWENHADKEFDKLIKSSYTPVNIIAKNVDYSPNMRDDTRKKKSLRPPKSSAAEKAKMRKEYKRQLVEKQKGAENMMRIAKEENNKFNKHMENLSVKYGEEASKKIPIRDIHDKCLEMGFDRLAEIDPKTLLTPYKNFIVPVGDEEEFMDFMYVLYDGIINLHTSLCDHCGCKFSDYEFDSLDVRGISGEYRIEFCCAGVEHVCICEKKNGCYVGEMLRGKTEFLFSFYHWLGTFSFEVRTLIETVMSVMVHDARIEIRSLLTDKVMTQHLGTFCDEEFVNLYKEHEEIISEYKEHVKILAASDLDIKIKSKRTSLLIFHIKRLKVYLDQLRYIYPSAVYEHKIFMMKNLECYGKILEGKVIAKTITEMAKIDYGWVKKEIGASLIAPNDTIREYKIARSKYEKKLRKEIEKIL